MRLVEDACSQRKDRIRSLAGQFCPGIAQLRAKGFIDLQQRPFIGGRKKQAGRVLQVGFHQAAVARYSRISEMVSSGSLMCGQWPVAFITRRVLFARCFDKYVPTSKGAMMSSEHCRIRAGI